MRGRADELIFFQCVTGLLVHLADCPLFTRVARRSTQSAAQARISSAPTRSAARQSSTAHYYQVYQPSTPTIRDSALSGRMRRIPVILPPGNAVESNTSPVDRFSRAPLRAIKALTRLLSRSTCYPRPMPRLLRRRSVPCWLYLRRAAPRSYRTIGFFSGRPDRPYPLGTRRRP